MSPTAGSTFGPEILSSTRETAAAENDESAGHQNIRNTETSISQTPNVWSI